MLQWKCRIHGCDRRRSRSAGSAERGAVTGIAWAWDSRRMLSGAVGTGRRSTLVFEVMP